MKIEDRENEYRFKFDTREEIRILTKHLIELRGSSMPGEGPFFLSLPKDDLPVWSDEKKRQFEEREYGEEPEE